MIDRMLRTALVVAILGLPVPAFAQPPAGTAQTPAGGQAQGTYTLRVIKEEVVRISLNAERARLSAIAADLAQRLGVRIAVGSVWANETVTINFSDSPLEAALTALGPRVYIDYEIRTNAAPAPREIHLLGLDEPLPAPPGASLGFMIQGHTEDTGTPPADDPLQVVFEKGRLSVISKQQPLALVVKAVADTLAVQADITYDASELVDMDIRFRLPEDGLLELSPNIRLLVRVDLSTGDRALRRVTLARGRAQ